ncbi:hypothetical protein [Lake Baikal phage Baikal-20-5m-C28]|nr:hypothetical protein [Lake Baikal phage Baikal-20-5m-C28]
MTIKLNNKSIQHVDGSQQFSSVEEKEFYVYNPDHWTVLNGGKCCLWTVPTGTTSIKFEILSGGGPGGSSGGDYDVGIGGQGGNYTVKTITRNVAAFIDGSQYTICAAGTSDCSCCCSCNMNCKHGCTSYVTGLGLSNFCAIGGMGGSTSWDVMSGCYNCFIGNATCDLGNYNAGWVNHVCNSPTYGGDIEFRGSSGSMRRTQPDCCADIHGVAGSPAGPFAAWHGIGGKHACMGNHACCSHHSSWPGGGGAAHITAATPACSGAWGAGGLVRVTYS